MEAPRDLRRHARSSSSLAGLPSMEPDRRRMSFSSLPELLVHPRYSPSDPLRVPLPASVPGSEDGGDEGDAHAAPAANTFSASALEPIPEPVPSLESPVGLLQSAAVPPPSTVRQFESPVGPSSEAADDSNRTSNDRNPSDVEVSILLADLLQALRKDHLQAEKSRALEAHLCHLLFATGSQSRLLAAQSAMSWQLAQSLCKEDKGGFEASYFQMSSRLANCDRTVETLSLGGDPTTPISGGLLWSSSWLQALSNSSRESLVTFLSQLRCDPSRLATCISELASSQLASLARPHRRESLDSTLSSEGSIFRTLEPQAGRMFGNATAHGLNPTDPFTQDPLLLLLHRLFASTNPGALREQRRRVDAWSSVCARVFEDGKPDFDKFILAVFDHFPSPGSVPPQPELDTFLAGLLQEGNLHGDPHSGPPSIAAHLRQSSSSWTSDSRFFDGALEEFLDIVSQDPSLLAAGSLDLIRATLEKIPDQGRKANAREFAFSRWFCKHLLGSVLIVPESFGLLLHHHVNLNARSKILRELAIRFDRLISDTLSSTPANPPIVELKLKILEMSGIFDSPSSLASETQPQADFLNPNRAPEQNHLTLSAQETLCMCSALTPGDSVDPSNASTIRSLASGVFSQGASSTATAKTNDGRTGTASSFAPSLSGTSMTSATFANEASTAMPSDFKKLPERSESRLSAADASGLAAQSELRTGTALHFLPDIWKLALSQDGQATQHPEPTCSVLYVQAGGALATSFPYEGESLPHSAPNTSSPLSSDPLSLSTHLPPQVAQGLLMVALEDSPQVSSVLSPCFGAISKLLEHVNSKQNQAQREHKFLEAHFWWDFSNSLDSLSPLAVAQMLREQLRMVRSRTEAMARWSNERQGWTSTLEARGRMYAHALRNWKFIGESLRDKMWYASDVRHSSTYEEVFNMARALKTMASPPKPKETGVAAWAKHKFRTSFGVERLQAQVLEALTAPRDRGGSKKLADAQVAITARWLVQESIENFCRGEERFHRFCFEIQQSVKRLAGETLLESPVLWSSSLYEPERISLFQRPGPSSLPPPLSPSVLNRDAAFAGGLHSLGGSKSSVVHPLSPSSHFSSQLPGYGAHDTYEHHRTNTRQPIRPSIQSNGAQNCSNAASTPWSDYHTMTSSKSSLDRTRSSAKGVFVGGIRANLTSLLLSDLGPDLWRDGAETDRWMRDEPFISKVLVQSSFRQPGQSLDEPDQQGVRPQEPDQSNQQSSAADSGKTVRQNSEDGACEAISTPQSSKRFNFEQALRKLLDSFQISADPRAKLRALEAIVSVVALKVHTSRQDSPLSSASGTSSSQDVIPSAGAQALGIPRTKHTWLQEVAANCEERRLACLASLQSMMSGARPSSLLRPSPPSTLGALRDPAVLASVQSLFLDPNFRPPTFFRDLQLIAAFVPASVLDQTTEGAAFWTVGLAAMTFKSHLTAGVTDAALQILAHAYSGRSQGTTNTGGDGAPGDARPQSPRREPSRKDVAPEQSAAAERVAFRNALDPTLLANTTLMDAARLYTRAAMEGDPIAARELGLFYLTHPELVPRVTLPLSRPGEVFGPVNVATAATGPTSTTMGPSPAVQLGTTIAPQRARAEREWTAGGADAWSNPLPGASRQRGGSGAAAAGGLDPATFAVAFHWMEFAANAGDADAITFFRENMELSSSAR